MFDQESLDSANIRLYRELDLILAAFDMYEIIGLNSDLINSRTHCRVFFAYVQNQALVCVILSLLKIYEVQNPRSKYQLGSIDGMLTLAKNYDKTVRLSSLVKGHVSNPELDWRDELEFLISEVRSKFTSPLLHLKHLRDKALAHLELGHAPISDLPSTGQVLEMIEFAERFRNFLNTEMLGVHSASTLSVRRARANTVKLLKTLGIVDVLLPEWQ